MIRRRTSILPVALALSLLTSAVGCGLTGGGAPAWKKGQSPQQEALQTGGTYELIAGKDEVAARYMLQPGEQLGFRTGSDGRVEAVAGIYSVPLNSTKTYRWRAAK